MIYGKDLVRCFFGSCLFFRVGGFGVALVVFGVGVGRIVG